MSYNILAINPGHNGSAAFVSDGELKYFIEEERLSKQKYDGNPFLGIKKVIEKNDIDVLVLGGTSNSFYPETVWTSENHFHCFIRKYYGLNGINSKKEKMVMMDNRFVENHHIGHAAGAFYNSGFDKALSIVIDGSGSLMRIKKDNDYYQGFETDSVYICEYPHKFDILFKRLAIENTKNFFDGVYEIDDSVPSVKAYEGVSKYLGFDYIEGGKTMGLAPYGKKDDNIPFLIQNGRGNKNIFRPHYPAGAIVDEYKNEYFRKKFNPKEWHKDFSKCPDVAKNLAYKIQKETQEEVLKIIKTSIEKTGIKKVCISGGYGLNCTANYFYRKNLPNDVELYCEPVSSDAGTAIGLAKLHWYIHTQSTEKKPSTTLYFGEKYDSTTYLNNVDKEKFNIEEASYDKIAKLISEKNIVSIFQGACEAGPRALGNRSILYDPTDPNGKDFVNTVKGREWFRPFAGTVLKEHAKDWFDLAGMEESPYMMYAVDVQADKTHIIPSITHVDNTCRIQTVTEEQNKHFYKLIQSFKEITGVPILFNTSFNLAGEPLVETIDDALSTLERSSLNYLYLPEISKLIRKKSTQIICEV